MKNILILSIGVLLIFISLYIFTQPALFKSWDFSSTGQIGDTIGGITAPILNLIGAFLVYISFQAQITANRIQKESLDVEKNQRVSNRAFDNYYNQYEQIMSRIDRIEYVYQPAPVFSGDNVSTRNHIIYTGLNGINQYVIDLERKERQGNSFGVFLNFQFVLVSMNELIRSIINHKDIVEEDKKFIIENVNLIYHNFLKDYADRILEQISNEDPHAISLKETISNINSLLLSK